MAGGVKSLLAPWLGGAASPPVTATQAGYRSVIGMGILVGSTAPVQAGYGSLIGFWIGGAGGGTTPPVVATVDDYLVRARRRGRR